MESRPVSGETGLEEESGFVKVWRIEDSVAEPRDGQDCPSDEGSNPAHAGWKSHRASFNLARAVCSRRLIVPTGLANRALISFKD